MSGVENWKTEGLIASLRDFLDASLHLYKSASRNDEKVNMFGNIVRKKDKVVIAARLKIDFKIRPRILPK